MKFFKILSSPEFEFRGIPSTLRMLGNLRHNYFLFAILFYLSVIYCYLFWIFYEMGRRCVVGGCSNTEFPCHKWPKEHKQGLSWQAFLRSTRSDAFSLSEITSICCFHFEEDCFENFLEWENGYSKSLRLRPGSVPTVRNCHANPVKDKIIAVVKERGKGQWLHQTYQHYQCCFNCMCPCCNSNKIYQNKGNI